MKIKVKQTDKLAGTVTMPGSKSQTIRALLIAALADGQSELRNPLQSTDTQTAKDFLRALGVQINDQSSQAWTVLGTGGQFTAPTEPLNSGNSGLTTNFFLPLAARVGAAVIVDCGEQMKQRPVAPMVEALRQLGTQVDYLEGQSRLPVKVSGELKGGQVTVEGNISQYLSSLLLNCPLAPEDTVISVNKLQENPYVEMTLKWLDDQKIRYQRQGWGRFTITGNQKYQAFTKAIPADFSSASYFLAAAALVPGQVTLQGLDFTDPQGDKELFRLVKKLGAKINIVLSSRPKRSGVERSKLRNNRKDL